MNQSLKIAFFVSLDGKSGTYFRYHNLAIGLVQRGHDVTIYSQSVDHWHSCREENRDGVSYVLAPAVPGNSYVMPSLNPGNILRRFFTGFQKRDALANRQILHLFQPFENSAYPWLWERNTRSELAREKVLFAWDWDDLWCGGLFHLETMVRFQDRLHYRLVEKLEHDLPKRADIITTCSTFLADRARQRGARQTEVIHNGFWPDLSTDVPASRTDLRRQFAMDPEAFYLGFTGFTANEFDWCLDLVARFTDDPRIRFVCCGADVRPAIAARSKSLIAKIDSLGFLPSADTRRLLGAVDVGLLPLDRTAFNESRLPIKFAEYLAAGLPILCSDVGEVGRLARKLNGVVLLPADRQGWTEGSGKAIRDLLANRAFYRPNPQQLKDLLSWPIMAAQLEQIYLKHFQVTGVN